ncbi:unnamed protein product [Chrysodeixis includens]|uniref:N-acetyltransferase domain-containing protein n=1 Tax=Chrysodeixis includens TaxID=689277 RepID=A0A9P0FPR5_CHRIL|nr:unnamed protein product [Chrysodeixis includens]
MTVPKKVWSRFSRKEDNIKLCILDAPEERIDQAIDLYIDHFLAEEPFSLASGIKNNEKAKAEYRDFKYHESKELKKLHVMICCKESEDETGLGEIVGVSFSLMTTTESPLVVTLKPKTKELQKLMELWDGMIELFDVLNALKVSKCFEGMGIIVHPDYRGLGIAQEFLRARRLLAKDHEVPITIGWMSSTGTQIAAQREGYETVFEFSFEEFGKKHGVSFENSPKTCKIMRAQAL